MEFLLTRNPLPTLPVDLVAVCCTKSPTDVAHAPARLQRADGGVALDAALNGLLTAHIAAEEFRGEVGSSRLIATHGKIPARHVLLLGAGDPRRFTLDTARQLGAAVVRAADQVRAASVGGVVQSEAIRGLPAAKRTQALVEGILLGSYRFDHYKAKDDRRSCSVKACHLIVARDRSAALAAIARGRLLGAATNDVRDLVNQPGNICTPQYLAEQARAIARKGKLQCTIFDQKQIVAQRMSLLNAVAQGAPNPPVFLHLRYTPPKKAKAHIAIVGKGVTFDTGGFDLKTSKHMEHMKNDMAGAGAVLATMQVIAALKPPLLIDAFCPCTENVLDGKAHRPGDIVTARSGKTVELLNLDAEGRLILADALDYALEKKPDYVIDIATLTGGVLYALGEIYTAVLGNDQPLINRLLAAGKSAGEPIWQLPLEQEYKKGYTTGPAELRNIGKTGASTISGALFLEEFVGTMRWAHLDIAESSWADEDRPYTPKGGTGVAVRTLCEFLLNY